jgi:riboflavin biosynthesis pyrimidine reductase
MRALPAGVRKFLRPSGVSAPSSAQVSRLLQNGELEEIRICWVPVLAGGDQVITLPFPTPRQMRINFRAVSLKQIGDILCAIYRRRR